jgi:hypothetical protein
MLAVVGEDIVVGGAGGAAAEEEVGCGCGDLRGGCGHCLLVVWFTSVLSPVQFCLSSTMPSLL